jgi:hypothetical protein
MRTFVLLVIVASVVAGCGEGTTASTPDLAVSSGIDIDNGTSLPVTMFVNGRELATILPGRHEELPGAALPSLPWKVEAKSPSGRVLLKFRVDPGVVTQTMNADGSTSSRSAGARVDLSCGRLDVYVGAGMSGPVAGPGVPGDCAP